MKKKQWLDQLIKSSHIGILVVDKERNNLFVNDYLCKMFGYQREELISRSAEILHVNHKSFLNFATLAFNAVLKGDSLSIEYQFKCKDGSLLWARISGDAIVSNNEVLWTIVDITHELENQEKINKLNERMELALLGSNDGIWDVNIKTGELFISSRAKEILGINDTKNIFDFSILKEMIHPDDIAKANKILQKRLEEHLVTSDEEYRFIKEDGTMVWVRSRAKSIFDKDGNIIRVVGTYSNITDEKNLQMKKEQLSLMLEQTNDAIITTDTEGYIESWNYGAERLFGYKPKEIIGKHILVLDPKNDLELFKERRKELLEVGELHLENDAITQAKDILRVATSYTLVKDEQLKVTSILAYGLDVTQRVEAENELKHQHKYLQSIIDGVDDPIMVIREDYNIEIMNSSLNKLLKHLTLQDPAHPKCYEVSHNRTTPCDIAEHPCPLRDVLETKKHVTVVHNHKTIDGKNRYIELSASPLFDKVHNCIGIIESARDITTHLQVQDELREQKNILDHQAHHDELTGLANRTLFGDRLSQSLEKAKRKKSTLALFFIDLDHFKEINDSLGHGIGDEILKIVALRLEQHIRNEDSVSRLGGDEFTIILEDLVDIQDAISVATKLLDVLAKPILIKEHTLYVSSSIGISVYPDDGITSENLLKFADAAMYRAKDEGRNNYQFYSKEMTEMAIERVLMETSLREAIVREEFVVYYQPQVDGRDNSIIGMEALVRWNHPTRGLLFPDTFIAVAETTGLLVDIDRFVMQSAMQQFSKWKAEGLHPGKLSLNLTIKHLNKDDFMEVFQEMIQKSTCTPQNLELEVVESEIMKNPLASIKILNLIKDLGVSISIDDFGTGYSSLAYLKKLPIKKLKIDKSFVDDLPNNEDDIVITQAVIGLAKSLNLDIIAEGVENEEQKKFLLENGCTKIQGYYYSKPLETQDMQKLLENGFQTLK